MALKEEQQDWFQGLCDLCIFNINGSERWKTSLVSSTVQCNGCIFNRMALKEGQQDWFQGLCNLCIFNINGYAR